MISTPSKNKFTVKHKPLKKIDRYLNSRRWIVLSTEKIIIVGEKTYSLFHSIDKKNYQQDINRAQINSKIILVGEYKDTINIYRYLQNQNKRVYLITV